MSDCTVNIVIIHFKLLYFNAKYWHAIGTNRVTWLSALCKPLAKNFQWWPRRQSLFVYHYDVIHVALAWIQVVSII